MKFSRSWAMPSPDTFSSKPIKEFVLRHLTGVSVDPFARNCSLATYTNDFNPDTTAAYHMDALAFLEMLAKLGVVADVLILDPPYSPRQISDCYATGGRRANMTDTQSSFYTKIRDAARLICRPGSVALSFGWNSTGMGREWTMEEIMLVAHGGAHNDTICLAQRMPQQSVAE